MVSSILLAIALIGLVFGLPIITTISESLPSDEKPKELCRAHPEISFDLFKNCYYVNPKTWELHDDYVIKWIMNDDVYNIRFPHKYLFSKKELKKYKTFLNDLEKAKLLQAVREQEIKNDKQLMLLLKDVQKEIDELQKQATEEINGAAKIYSEVSARLAKEVKE